MKSLDAGRGGLFLTEGKIGVLSVSSLFFFAGGSVCGCMLYVHTHAHHTDGVLCCEPRSRDETPGEPEES
jgi:hypothetical protein